jgi:hypothetical protein
LLSRFVELCGRARRDRYACASLKQGRRLSRDRCRGSRPSQGNASVRSGVWESLGIALVSIRGLRPRGPHTPSLAASPRGPAPARSGGRARGASTVLNQF